MTIKKTAFALACPKCGESGRIDEITGFAHISRVFEDGEIEWAGQTDVDWNSQRPEKDAGGNPIYICLACEFESSLADFDRQPDNSIQD